MQLPIVVVILWFDGVDMLVGEDRRGRDCEEDSSSDYDILGFYLFKD